MGNSRTQCVKWEDDDFSTGYLIFLLIKLGSKRVRVTVRYWEINEILCVKYIGWYMALSKCSKMSANGLAAAIVVVECITEYESIY